jgi:hypothetical protein
VLLDIAPCGWTTGKKKKLRLTDSSDSYRLELANLSENRDKKKNTCIGRMVLIALQRLPSWVDKKKNTCFWRIVPIAL